MKYCHSCGAQLVPDAAFCSHCGTRVVSIEEVAPATPAPTPAPAPAATEDAGPEHIVVTDTPAVPRTAPPAFNRRPWWVVPALVIGSIVVAAFVLMAMPFGGDRIATTSAVAETADQTDSIVQVVTDPPPAAAMPPNVAPNVSSARGAPPATTATTAGAADTAPPSTTSMVADPTSPLPVGGSLPQPGQQQPLPVQGSLPRTETGELTAAAATATLLNYIRSTNYYQTDPECVRAVNQGYKNEGYTFEVWGDCGGERRLGSWRVDAKKGELFRQHEDGRYLDP